MTASLTKITASKPTRLTKQFSLSDGKLNKVGGGNLVEGKAATCTFDTLEDFRDLLLTLKSNQALVYGVSAKSPIRIIPKEKWVSAGKPDNCIPRTAEAFHWPTGAGILMLDYDPPSDGKALECAELVASLRNAVPGLQNASMVWWPSASSCIVNGDTDEQLTGLRGQRLYLLVADAADIPRAGQAITEALWGSGFGYFTVSSSGNPLARTLFDASVWQTNRLDFAAGAACEAPLRQDRGKPKIIDAEFQVIDTATLIPDPSADIIAKAEANRAKERALKSAEAEVARQKWIEEKTEELVGFVASTNDHEVARACALRAVEHGCLSGDFIIQVIIGSETTSVTVRELLDEPSKFHGLLTLDPIEPTYRDRKVVGKLYLFGGQPRLHTFAHGERTFRLMRAIEHIELEAGRTHDAVNATLKVLRELPGIFDFGAELVVIDQGRLFPLDEPGLTHLLGGVIQYSRWRNPSAQNRIKQLCDPPTKLAKQLLSLGHRRDLKSLDALVTAPTLRPDGTVLDRPGYDPDTCLLFEIENEISAVPNAPTIEEVRLAMDALLKPFSKFPFVGALDRSVLLAALLTAVIRPALPTSPAFGFDAPSQASGKTLLASCIGVLATGDDPGVWPHTSTGRSGQQDEETRKRIFTAMRSGTRAIIWDNVNGIFDSAAMAAALTSPTITDRLLGKHESSSVPNRAVFLFTGNNLTFSGDLSRRVLTCRIDARTERPFAREFAFNPKQYVLDNRQELAVAALTIVRGWLTSGAERATGRMASFELWDEFIRQAVAWVAREICPDEFTDPMNAVIEAHATDPEHEALSELFQAWRQKFGSEYIAAGEIYRIAKSDFPNDETNSIAEALIELSNGNAVTSAKSVGRILRYRLDRIVNGLRLEARDDKRKGSKVWRVVKNKE